MGNTSVAGGGVNYWKDDKCDFDDLGDGDINFAMREEF